MATEQTAWCPCTCHRPHQHAADESDLSLVAAILTVAHELRVNNLIGILGSGHVDGAQIPAITAHLRAYIDQTVGGAS